MLCRFTDPGRDLSWGNDLDGQPRGDLLQVRARQHTQQRDQQQVLDVHTSEYLGIQRLSTILFSIGG